MANPTFTIQTQFGLSSGPTYQGAKVVAAAPVAANPTLISAPNVLQTTTVVVDADGFDITEYRGMGFLANLSAVQTGVPGATPSVTIRFINADGGAADIDIVLYDGESVAFIEGELPVGFDTSPDRIDVIGDVATADFDVYGIINLGS